MQSRFCTETLTNSSKSFSIVIVPLSDLGVRAKVLGFAEIGYLLTVWYLCQSELRDTIYALCNLKFILDILIIHLYVKCYS